MGFCEENDNKCSMDDFKTRRNATLTDWLNEMEEEETLFLTSQVKQIALEVFSETKFQAKSKRLPTCVDEDEIFQKMAIVKENLKFIIQQFQMVKKDKKQFIREYPIWQQVRSQSIEALHTIGNSINDVRRNSNIARVVGNSTSFVGGGICVASAALIPFTFGLTTPLAVVGGVTTALGSTTSIGTSITEALLLKKKVERAKTIIEDDKSSFKSLQDWLITSNTVTEAMDAILSIDVDNKIRNVIEIMKTFVNVSMRVRNATDRIPLVRNIVEMVLHSLSPQFLLITVVPSLLGFLVILAVLYHMNESMFSNAFKTWETITTRVSSVANVSLGILQPAAAIIFKTDAMVAQNVAKAVLARGLVAVIGMSLDAASIVLTTIDLHKGSVCNEGKKIKETADSMKEEADILEEVYAKLISFSG